MFIRLLRIMARPMARLFVLVGAAIFLSYGFVFAQNISYPDLPRPGTLLAQSRAASYPSFTGIRFDPDNPLKLTFLADRAGKNVVDKNEASRLIYYFLAGLTLPEDELWVNLSPYEQDRVAGDHLAVTDLGRDMLVQDYLLKQLTASLTYPESAAGKDYWSDVYDAVFKKLGTTNIAVNSFNKVWITPGAITLYEKGNTAYIGSADLKVMTDFDYNALKNNLSDTVDPTVEITAQVLRDKLVPVITREVNQGERFAPLRQIYRSLILAVWFKKKFKESFYKSYIGAAKVKGIDLAEKNSREKIFNLYVEAFKKGSYNYIRHDYDKRINKRLRRRYYSGGIAITGKDITSAIEAAVRAESPPPVGRTPLAGAVEIDAIVAAAGPALGAPVPQVAAVGFSGSAKAPADESAREELRQYKARCEALASLKPNLSAHDREFIARSEMAIAYTDLHPQSGPNRLPAYALYAALVGKRRAGTIGGNFKGYRIFKP